LLDVFLLGWIGAKPIEYPFLGLGQLISFGYYFIILESYTFFVLFENFLLSEYWRLI